MSEKLKSSNQEVENKLSGLEYKSRPTLEEQLDTVENFREKIKLMRVILGNIKGFMDSNIDYNSGRGQSTAELDILLKNFDLITDISNSLRKSKVQLTKQEIEEYRLLEKNRCDLLIYLNLKTINGRDSSRRIKNN